MQEDRRATKGCGMESKKVNSLHESLAMSERDLSIATEIIKDLIDKYTGPFTNMEANIKSKLVRSNNHRVGLQFLLEALEKEMQVFRANVKKMSLEATPQKKKKSVRRKVRK